MLKKTLVTLGFSQKEADVYLAVLESGHLSYTDVSKKTGLNRTTVYGLAKDLISRGLLVEDIASPVKVLIASPPEALSSLTSREEEVLGEKKRLVMAAIDDIRSMPSISQYVAPAITFVPEHRIASYLRERNDDWNAAATASDKTWWGFQDVSFVAAFSDWITWYWQNAPQEITLKLFSNDAEIERETQLRTPFRREIRFWSGTQEFTGTLWVIGDIVVNINARQKPFSLVETRDATLAHNLRAVFEALWETKPNSSNSATDNRS